MKEKKLIRAARKTVEKKFFYANLNENKMKNVNFLTR